jgi:hypothetical protein
MPTPVETESLYQGTITALALPLDEVKRLAKMSQEERVKATSG